MRCHRRFISALEHSIRDSRNWVIIQLMDVQGSSFRQMGARMLVWEDGSSWGMISGGCLEQHLKEQALACLQSGQPKVEKLDNTPEEDLVWGMGLGCNGILHVLYEPVFSAHLPPYLLQWLQHMRNHQSVRIDSVMAGTEPCHIQRTVSAQDPTTPEGSNLGKLWKISESISPPITLGIIGCGQDADAFYQQAIRLGWNTLMIDHRQDLSNISRFPEAILAARVSPGELQETTSGLRIRHWVLMTHRFDIDLQYLEALSGGTWSYLGLMGPASRRQLLHDHATPEVKKLLEEPCIHGPIGLDIGSDMPEEIAVSCCAEILATINRRKGGKLSSSQLSIHPRT